MNESPECTGNSEVSSEKNPQDDGRDTLTDVLTQVECRLKKELADVSEILAMLQSSDNVKEAAELAVWLVRLHRLHVDH